jgi:outer membrane receptor for ferrienterochelin and colicin
MNNRILKSAMYIAMGMSLAAALPATVAHAANADGSLVGRLTDSDNKPLAEAEVTVRNPDTGFTRTVKADANGNYRFPYLPVGKYIVEATKAGATLGKLAEVTVALGAATTADVTVAMTTLEEIQVLGTRIVTAVDVKSTESAMNVTREELERLPVERDLLSVAMLAPGLTRGDASMCVAGNCGVSFGGSSIAENTVYINGLNVTDFYNRVGSSTVPYSFYKEFQVKTGGYSVEFGRTTGGVINAVTRSGTNEFDFGTEVVWEPSSLQSSKTDRFNRDGTPRIIGSHDEYDRTNATFYASGPILRDRLFFFALYEERDYNKLNTNDSGTNFQDGVADDAFWGAKIDWQISDSHLLELLAFSDENERVTDTFAYTLSSNQKGAFQGKSFNESGGMNWATTYTGYLTDNFTVKALYGENERDAAIAADTDLECSRVQDRRANRNSPIDLSCSRSSAVLARTDTREAARLDFEWVLGDHQLRFGLDHETNTSEHSDFNTGPDHLLYEIFRAPTGGEIVNDTTLAAGTEYVRTRNDGVAGEFETINSAYYLEDNWAVTDSLVLNAGVRLEAFDNKNSDGDSFIKIDDMVAPRVGFSWDLRGDNRTKVFGNAGRYFLPVANVINIKQAGGFIDERTHYFLGGLESFTFNGQTYQRPILGAQFGPVDNSQGDGTVRDLRGTVDQDMDPVYQDELILGFQSMLGDKWSWGVRGIYRKLNNAIDDMRILSTGIVCAGRPNRQGFVMGNPGDPLTVLSDTNCNGAGGTQGDNDSLVTVDLSNNGWASFSGNNGGGTFLGIISGFPEPKRTYKALEFVVDRAWDDHWSMNASYTLSFSEGNAEGPVNSDFNFADAGRTEAFDDPWVNFGGDGYLANDRRHQLKLRGSYGLGEHWRFGASLNAASGRPISKIGVGNSTDGQSFHSFMICTANCTAANVAQRVYELHPRGTEGRTPWIFDLGLNVSYEHSFSVTDLQLKLSVYNVLNQEREVEVNEIFQSSITGAPLDSWGLGAAYQSPRYATLTLKLDF